MKNKELVLAFFSLNPDSMPKTQCQSLLGRRINQPHQSPIKGIKDGSLHSDGNHCGGEILSTHTI